MKAPEKAIKKLEQATANNLKLCDKLKANQFVAGATLVVPGLEDNPLLSDREVLIYQVAFTAGVEAALQVVREAGEPQEDLIPDLLDPQ
jgi:hypothetical protein